MKRFNDCLYVGNTVTEELVNEVLSIVNGEGTINICFDVTGRTKHVQLAEELKSKLPQFDYVIGYEMYLCKVSRKGWIDKVNHGYTIALLKSYAKDHGISIGGATRKVEIINAINHEVEIRNKALMGD